MSLSKEGELQRILALGEAFKYVNITALILSIVLFLIIGITYMTNFSASKRLSYKLYFFIAIADILTHAPVLVQYNFDMLTCHSVNLIAMFSNFFSTYITACMAYNLMIIFLLDKPIYVKSCTFYVSICTLLCIILCIPIAVMSFTNIETCPYYLRYGFPIGKIVLFFSFGLWILLPTLFCFTIFIIVIIKLNKYKNKSSHNSSNATQQFNLKRMVTRLILYPTVPVITIVPYIASICLMGPDNKLSYSEYFLQYFCSSIAGILNFIFFLFDPALPSIYDEFLTRYINKKVPNDDDKVYFEMDLDHSVNTVNRKMLI